MKPPKIAGAICALLALTLPACSPTGVAQDLAMRTDKTEYRLQQVAGGYYVLTVQVAVTNPLDRTVFLHRHCGGEDPARRLVRPDGDTTRTRLYIPICMWPGDNREPIPLQSGDTYLDQVEMVSAESPNSNPPDRIEMRTGEFMLVYTVQLTNAIGEYGAVDPLPPERTMSNRFVVLPPD